MSDEPVLHLRERTARRCRLSPAEVRHLLTHHRDHLELVPDLKPGRWRVTPRGVVGVILGPERRIVIAPKIPLCNLALLLDPSRAQLTPGDPLPESAFRVLDVLGARLAELMQQCAAVGLHRAYSEQSLNSPYLVGRLDLADHLRNLAQGRQQLPCIADQFTQDLPWNQVPVSVASILLGCGELSEVTRGRLLTARSGFGAIREVPLTANVLGELHKAPPSYRELIDLCLLLLENRSPSVLLSLEGLFERYVTKLVERANCGQVEVQKTERYPCADPEAAPLLIRPDVQVVSQEQRIVIDAKWKVLREKPEDGDVHQIVAYAALTGATRSLLIYPGGKRKNYEYAIAGHVATRLWAQTLCVSGSLRRCLREARRLQQFLRTLAREKSEKSPR